MAKIDVSVLHEQLAAAGIPVVTVRLTHEQKIELEFDTAATDDQKAAAQAIVTDYQRPVEDAAPAVKSRAPKK